MSEKETTHEFLEKAEGIFIAASMYLVEHLNGDREITNSIVYSINDLLYVANGYKELLNKEYVDHACFEMDVASALGWDSKGVSYVDQIKKLVQENKDMKKELGGK